MNFNLSYPVEYWDKYQALRLGYFQRIILRGRYKGLIVLYNEYAGHCIRVDWEQIRDTLQLPY